MEINNKKIIVNISTDWTEQSVEYWDTSDKLIYLIHYARLMEEGHNENKKIWAWPAPSWCLQDETE